MIAREASTPVVLTKPAAAPVRKLRVAPIGARLFGIRASIQLSQERGARQLGAVGIGDELGVPALRLSNSTVPWAAPPTLATIHCRD